MHSCIPPNVAAEHACAAKFSFLFTRSFCTAGIAAGEKLSFTEKGALSYKSHVETFAFRLNLRVGTYR